jgi:ribonuclease BN (tRNA processing enzyme)
MTTNDTSTQIVALGTGSAFTMKGKQTNLLVKRNGKNLLIDCGQDIRWALNDFGLSFKDLDAVYVSHAHADHIGGLEYIGFTRYFTKKGMEAGGAPNPLPLPTLFCEHGWVRDLWDKSLRGGMEGLEGIDCTLETFFNVVPVKKNSHFMWEGLKFDIVQSLHISAKYAIVDSFGVMFTDENGKRVYITTDVQFAPETSMKAYYKESDVVIHDCETMYFPNGKAMKSGVHAHYEDLKTLSLEVKSKMRLIHYYDNVVDDFDNWQGKAFTDGFWGFCKPGLIYQTNE